MRHVVWTAITAYNQVIVMSDRYGLIFCVTGRQSSNLNVTFSRRCLSMDLDRCQGRSKSSFSAIYDIGVVGRPSLTTIEAVKPVISCER
jgi:hypothetical protein